INYAITASVSTPAAVTASAVVAATIAASADTNSDTDANRRWRRRLVHNARRRTANHNDIIHGLGTSAPRRLALGPLRRNGIDALDRRHIDLLDRRRRLRVAGTGRPGQRDVLRHGSGAGSGDNRRREVGTVAQPL